MYFDSLTLRTIVSELRNTILGGTIRHVFQSRPDEIVFKISGTDGNQNLLLSSHSMHARAHLVKRTPKAKERFHFASFLMQHIARGTVKNIEQVGFDRILKIYISPPESLVDISPKVLIAEFMGKHSNIIFVDENSGKILESIKRIDKTMSRFRQVLPGLEYVLPPQREKLKPFGLDYSTFSSALEGDAKKQTWRALLNNIDGMSPALAKEIVARAETEVESSGTLQSQNLEVIWEAFKEVIEPFQNDSLSPQVFASPEDETDVLAVAALPLVQFAGSQRLPFSSMSEALECFYDCITLKEETTSQINALKQALKKKREAGENKLVALSEDLATAENAEDFRIEGELLTANLFRLRRGQSEIEVENYYDENMGKIVIKLDPSLSPSDNAQRYFRRYTKAKKSLTVIKNLIAENQSLLDVVAHYESQVEQAGGLERLLKIRKELVEKGWISEVGKKRKKERKEDFRIFTSSDGFKIYVGRNNRENELLIKHVAKKDDMWLHAKQIAGSHVIIRNPERKPGIPMPTLMEAAKLAARFSKAGKSSHVLVDYTWAKYVVKPKGTDLGFVTYTREKTLFVDPD